MPDSTVELQEKISKACSEGLAQPNRVVAIRLEKGDYAVQMLTIPKRARALIFSTNRVRILYTGKRNRPMFLLEDGSELILKGKIELYYNTNNVQEVKKLMIKSSTNSRAEISEEVKVSLFSLKQ